MKKKHVIILSSLAAAFLLLLTLALLGKFVWGWFDDPEDEPYIQPDLKLGESYYYFGETEIRDVVLIYAQYDRSDLYRIRVKNTDGENYFFLNTQGISEDYFLLGECDENGKFSSSDLYSPPIAGAVTDFSYSSLYDSTTTIPQMIAAVGALPITERIYPEEGVSMETFLQKYGLAASEGYEPAYFELTPYARDPKTDGYIYTPVNGDGEIVRYLNGKYYYWEAGNVQGAEYTAGAATLIPVADQSEGSVRRVYIGNPTVDDSGYYIYLEGRDVVYTTNSPYIADIVERGLGYYIAPRLVAEVSTTQYIMTPGFTIRDGKYVSEGSIAAGSTVGIRTDKVVYEVSDGGQSGEKTDVFSMIDLSDTAQYAAFISALSGKAIGDKVDVIVPINALTKRSATISYTIRYIVGIVKGTTYYENTGEVLNLNEDSKEKLVIVYDVGGTEYRGYVDLATAPAELRDLLNGCTVSKDVSVNKVYLKQYGATGQAEHKVTFAVTNISSVTNADGKSVKTVDYGTTVTFSYRLEVNGEVGGVTNMTITLPEKGTEEGQFSHDATWTTLAVSWLQSAGYQNATGSQNVDMTAYMLRGIAEGLLGKSKGTKVDSDNKSSLPIDIFYAIEDIYDYHLYLGAEAEYCVEYTESLSFAYQNDRDIFYGSSLYQNTTQGKEVYALDYTTTEDVVALFQNLTGDETVAVGIDSETIDRYGLHAYHLRYVMPYNLTDQTVGDKTYYYPGYEVPFDLYISDVQADGSRYIGSTQYNIVVRVADGSIFDFLEWSFYAKWMQNSVLLVSYSYLRRMVFDLNFAEEDGEEYNSVWGFDITVDPKYQYSGNAEETMARLYAAVVNLGEHVVGRGYTELNGLMQYKETLFDPSKEGKETVAGKLARIINESSATGGIYKELINEGWQDLDEIFGNQLTSNGVDKTGSDGMRGLLQLLNAMRYSGESSEEWSDEEIETITAGEYTMRLALTLLDQTKKNSKEQGYMLTFYNVGVNALVVVEKINEDGTTGVESSHFYIRSREVIKIAQTVVGLTQGIKPTPDHY